MDKNLQEWHESAPFWEKHASTIRTMFAPVTAALIEEAGIVKGQKVLDVAGGAGEPSLTIAEVVGPSGAVTFTDAIAKMVSAAKNEAQRRGLTNIEFHQSPADSLPFTDGSFDAVVCRLGVMFFPDPPAALREMLRVTKRGGVLVLAVWYKSELNPFSYEITEVVARHIPTSEGTPPAHDAFRFAELGKLARLLEEAGATAVREQILEFDITAPISPQEFWEMRSETSGTLREKLLSISSETRGRVREDLLSATAQYFSQNHMKFPAQMLLISGSKPR